MEIYANIHGFPNYQVSNYGNVKNIKTNKILSPGDNRKGYLYVNLWNEKGIHREYVHRLVANTFISNINKYPIINHKDEDPHNNNANNLEWCTNQYNLNYGSTISKRKFNADKMGYKIRCVETGIEYPSIREAARMIHRANNNILSAIKRNGTCAGYHWQLIDA
jgi:hypothetical protein